MASARALRLEVDSGLCDGMFMPLIVAKARVTRNAVISPAQKPLAYNAALWQNMNVFFINHQPTQETTP
jgi:hypothetical protein